MKTWHEHWVNMSTSMSKDHPKKHTVKMVLIVDVIKQNSLTTVSLVDKPNLFYSSSVAEYKNVITNKM